MAFSYLPWHKFFIGVKVPVLKKCEGMVGLVLVGNQKATYRAHTQLGSYILSPARLLQNLPWFLILESSFRKPSVAKSHLLSSGVCCP